MGYTHCHLIPTLQALNILIPLIPLILLIPLMLLISLMLLTLSQEMLSPTSYNHAASKQRHRHPELNAQMKTLPLPADHAWIFLYHRTKGSPVYPQDHLPN